MRLSWKETVKLGKIEVVRRLRELNIKIPSLIQYFKLCSLLYRASVKTLAPVLSIAEKRLERCKQAEKEARNMHEYLEALANTAKAGLYV